MNAAKSILALSLYLARKSDMELTQVTEEDNKKQRQKTQSPKKDKNKENTRGK